MIRRTVALCVLICTAASTLNGCGGGEAESEPVTTGGAGQAESAQRNAKRATAPAEPNETSAADRRNRMKSLLALPYAGWVEDEEADGLVVCDPARSYPGYTLYTIRMAAKAVVLDHLGNAVHQWHDPSSQQWGRVALLPNGDVFIVGVDRTSEQTSWIPDQARYLMRVDWNGRLIWKRRLNAHHDVATTPTGDLMVLAFERRKLPAVHAKVDVRDDIMVLLTQAGKPLGRLSFYEAVVGNPGIFPLLEAPVKAMGGQPWVDLFHSNSIEWMHHAHLFAKDPLYGPDNVLVCFRCQDRIAVFDAKKGRVVWSWGQGEISGPHDAQVLDSGRILLFDNGLARGWSRVIEVEPPGGQVIWEYKAPTPTDFYTASRGSVQRLPNGNTLIANSDNGEIFEVTAGGDVVWRYLCPQRNDKGQRATIVRARRLEKAFIEQLLAKNRR